MKCIYPIFIALALAAQNAQIEVTLEETVPPKVPLTGAIPQTVQPATQPSQQPGNNPTNIQPKLTPIVGTQATGESNATNAAKQTSSSAASPARSSATGASQPAFVLPTPSKQLKGNTEESKLAPKPAGPPAAPTQPVVSASSQPEKASSKASSADTSAASIPAPAPPPPSSVPPPPPPPPPQSPSQTLPTELKKKDPAIPTPPSPPPVPPATQETTKSPVRSSTPGISLGSLEREVHQLKHLKKWGQVQAALNKAFISRCRMINKAPVCRKAHNWEIGKVERDKKAQEGRKNIKLTKEYNSDFKQCLDERNGLVNLFDALQAKLNKDLFQGSDNPDTETSEPESIAVIVRSFDKRVLLAEPKSQIYACPLFKEVDGALKEDGVKANPDHGGKYVRKEDTKKPTEAAAAAQAKNQATVQNPSSPPPTTATTQTPAAAAPTAVGIKTETTAAPQASSPQTSPTAEAKPVKTPQSSAVTPGENKAPTRPSVTTPVVPQPSPTPSTVTKAASQDQIGDPKSQQVIHIPHLTQEKKNEVAEPWEAVKVHSSKKSNRKHQRHHKRAHSDTGKYKGCHVIKQQKIKVHGNDVFVNGVSFNELVEENRRLGGRF